MYNISKLYTVGGLFMCEPMVDLIPNTCFVIYAHAIAPCLPDVFSPPVVPVRPFTTLDKDRTPRAGDIEAVAVVRQRHVVVPELHGLLEAGLRGGRCIEGETKGCWTRSSTSTGY